MVRFHRTIRISALPVLLAVLSLVLVFIGSQNPLLAKAKHRHSLKKGGHGGKKKHRKGVFNAVTMERNREMALKFLRQNSPTLANIAGLPPLDPSELHDSALIHAVLSESEFDDSTADAEDQNDDIAFDSGDSNSAEILGPHDAEELAKYDSVKLDINEFKKEWLSYIADTSASITVKSAAHADEINKKALMAMVMNWLGTRYYFGGTNARGIDCSAFTRMVFDSVCKLQLPRSAREQFLNGMPVEREDLKFGDLIFFHTRTNPYISHVAIYLGDNLFAHASSHYGVTISSLQSDYYDAHFIEGRRVFPAFSTASAATPDNESDRDRLSQ